MRLLSEIQLNIQLQAHRVVAIHQIDCFIGMDDGSTACREGTAIGEKCTIGRQVGYTEAALHRIKADPAMDAADMGIGIHQTAAAWVTANTDRIPIHKNGGGPAGDGQKADDTG